MSVFQRRLASSTYALLRSFERRKHKLEELIDAIRAGRLSEEQLARQQRHLDALDDVFETHTADEDAVTGDEREQHEEFEDQALSGTVAVSLTELEAERLKVEALLNQARQLFDTGEESKFEKLREVLRDPPIPQRKAHHLHRAPRHRRLPGASARRAGLYRPGGPDSRRPAVPGARTTGRVFPPAAERRRGPAIWWPPTLRARASTSSSAG